MVIHITSIADLEITLSEVRSNLYFAKTTLQPLIIVIGDSLSELKNFYVYLNEAKFKYSTFLASLDLCFKIFHVLHLEYPSPCYGAWLFIQKFFYEIDTILDKPSPKVSGLISHLKST